MGKELSGRMESFCRHYVRGDAAGRNPMNATQAAIRAGYSERSARQEAHVLMNRPEILDRISFLAAEAFGDVRVDPNVVLIELLRMLTSDAREAMTERGAVKSIHDIPIDVRRAIASFEVEEEWGPFNELLGEREVSGRIVKVKFWSKEKAAELVGKHLGMFRDILKLEGLDELARRIAEARRLSGREPLTLPAPEIVDVEESLI